MGSTCCADATVRRGEVTSTDEIPSQVQVMSASNVESSEGARALPPEECGTSPEAEENEPELKRRNLDSLRTNISEASIKEFESEPKRRNFDSMRTNYSEPVGAFGSEARLSVSSNQINSAASNMSLQSLPETQRVDRGYDSMLTNAGGRDSASSAPRDSEISLSATNSDASYVHNRPDRKFDSLLTNVGGVQDVGARDSYSSDKSYPEDQRVHRGYDSMATQVGGRNSTNSALSIPNSLVTQVGGRNSTSSAISMPNSEVSFSARESEGGSYVHNRPNRKFDSLLTNAGGMQADDDDQLRSSEVSDMPSEKRRNLSSMRTEAGDD